jgi:hypothetical protein
MGIYLIDFICHVLIEAKLANYKKRKNEPMLINLLPDAAERLGRYTNVGSKEF